MTTLKDLFAGLLHVIFFPICSWAEGNCEASGGGVRGSFPYGLCIFVYLFPQRRFLDNQIWTKAGGKTEGRHEYKAIRLHVI